MNRSNDSINESTPEYDGLSAESQADRIDSDGGFDTVENGGSIENASNQDDANIQRADTQSSESDIQESYNDDGTNQRYENDGYSEEITQDESDASGSQGGFAGDAQSAETCDAGASDAEGENNDAIISDEDNDSGDDEINPLIYPGQALRSAIRPDMSQAEIDEAMQEFQNSIHKHMVSLGYTNRQFSLLNKAKKLNTAASICGPISIIIGGVLLATIGLVCSLVARSNLKQIPQDTKVQRDFLARYIRSNRTAIIICILALILNAVSVAIMFPHIVEYAQTGDLSVLYGSTSAPLPSVGGSAGSSTWG